MPQYCWTTTLIPSKALTFHSPGWDSYCHLTNWRNSESFNDSAKLKKKKPMRSIPKRIDGNTNNKTILNCGIVKLWREGRMSWLAEARYELNIEKMCWFSKIKIVLENTTVFFTCKTMFNVSNVLDFHLQLKLSSRLPRLPLYSLGEKKTNFILLLLYTVWAPRDCIFSVP